MSYILDALRKAEAERERGSVPGIHAQPVRQASAEASARARMPAWVWAVVAACVLLAGLLVWQMAGRGHEAAAPVMAASTAAKPVAGAAPDATLPAGRFATPIAAPPSTGATTPAVAAATAPPSMRASAATPATATATPPAKAPPLPAIAAALRDAAPVARKPVPAASAAVNPATTSVVPPVAAPSVAVAATPPSTAPQPVPPVTAQRSVPLASAAPGAQPAEPRVYALNELPDDIRRQIPNLSVSGSMYSAVPANRLVIFNGQVFHEGDKVTTDLVLEQIKPKAAVLRFKTYRYSMSY
ncbi:hypothetical protein BH11PSE8_BH11PSE8_14060 [soil metagenome]